MNSDQVMLKPDPPSSEEDSSNRSFKLSNGLESSKLGQILANHMVKNLKQKETKE